MPWPTKKLGMSFRLLIILFLVLAAVFYFQENFQENSKNFYSPSLSDFSSRIATTTAPLISVASTTAAKKIFAPAPLKIIEKFPQKEIPQTILTSLNVIVWTNTERAFNGLPLLKENEKLKAAAMAKLNDMFLKQYFNHVSPEGFDSAYLMKNAGYEFIVSGENLAMGDFEDDKKLVEAWMNSPGHRANILNPRFEEIGVAVARGIFENMEVWLAVQEFGLPLSACPQPEPALKNQIEQTQNQIDNLKSQIEDKIQELESKKFNGRREYNQKINEYNELVNQYNNLIETIKSLIFDYNNQVNDFNFCLAR